MKRKLLKYTLIVLTLFIGAGFSPDAKAISTPTLTLTDQASKSPDYATSQIVDITIGNDADAVAWLISETQDTKPDTDAAGWSTSKPDTFTLSADDGLKTVYLWGKDAAGNINLCLSSDSIVLDTIAPEDPTLTLTDRTSGSPDYTNSRIVNVTIGNDTEAVAWLLSEDQGFRPTPHAPGWTTSDTITFTISADEGLKTVYLWVKDAAGNINPGKPAVSDSITLDTREPAIAQLKVTSTSDYFYDPGLSPRGGTVYFNSRSGEGAGQNLTVTAEINEMGNFDGAFAFGDDPDSDSNVSGGWTQTYSVEADATTQAGIVFTATDRAGNATTATITFIQDNEPPTYTSTAPDAVFAEIPYLITVNAYDTAGIKETYLRDFLIAPGFPEPDTSNLTLPLRNSMVDTAPQKYVGYTTYYYYYAVDNCNNRGAIAKDTTFILPSYGMKPIKVTIDTEDKTDGVKDVYAHYNYTFTAEGEHLEGADRVGRFHLKIGDIFEIIYDAEAAETFSVIKGDTLVMEGKHTRSGNPSDTTDTTTITVSFRLTFDWGFPHLEKVPITLRIVDKADTEMDIGYLQPPTGDYAVNIRTAPEMKGWAFSDPTLNPDTQAIIKYSLGYKGGRSTKLVPSDQIEAIDAYWDQVDTDDVKVTLSAGTTDSGAINFTSPSTSGEYTYFPGIILNNPNGDAFSYYLNETGEKLYVNQVKITAIDISKEKYYDGRENYWTKSGDNFTIRVSAGWQDPGQPMGENYQGEVVLGSEEGQIGATIGLRTGVSKKTEEIERLNNVTVISIPPGTKNDYGPSFFIDGADTTQDLVWDGQKPLITGGSWNEDSPYLWINDSKSTLYFSSQMDTAAEVELRGTATDKGGVGLKEMQFAPVTSLACYPTSSDTTPAEWSGTYLINKDSYADATHLSVRVVLTDRAGNSASKDYYYQEDNEAPKVTIEAIEDTAGHKITAFDGSQSLDPTSTTVWAKVEEQNTRVAKVTLSYYTTSSVTMEESDTPSLYFGVIPGSAIVMGDTVSFGITAEDEVGNDSYTEGKYGTPWPLQIEASYFKDYEGTNPLPYNRDNLPAASAGDIYIKVTTDAALKELSLSIDAPGEGNDISALLASPFNGSDTTWIAKFTVSPEKDGEASILVTTTEAESGIIKPNQVPDSGDKFMIDTTSPRVDITSIDKIVEPYPVYVFIKDTSTVYFKNDVEGLKATVTLKVSASDNLSGFADKIQGSLLFGDTPSCSAMRGATAAECPLGYEINQGDTGGMITVIVSDIAGNIGSDTLTCLLDNDPPPRIMGLTANDGATWSDTVGIRLTWDAITDPGSGLDHYEVKYKESNWQAYETGEIYLAEEDDAAAFYIRGVDRVGNTRSQAEADSTVIGIDLTPPRLSITKINGIEYMEDTWLKAEAESFAGSCSDTVGTLKGSGIDTASFKYSLDGGENWASFNDDDGQPGGDGWSDTDEIPMITQQDSGQAGKPLMIYARDMVGHTVASDTVCVRVDTTPPEISLQWVEDESGNRLTREELVKGGSILTKSAYTVTVTVNDAPIAPEKVEIRYTTGVDPFDTTNLVLYKELTPVESAYAETMEYRGTFKEGIKPGDTVSFTFIAVDRADNQGIDGPFSFRLPDPPEITLAYLLDLKDTLPSSASGNPVTKAQKIYIRAVADRGLKEVCLSITLDGDTIAAVCLKDEGDSLSFISEPITIPEDKNGQAEILIEVTDSLGERFSSRGVPKLEIDTIKPTVEISKIDTRGKTLFSLDPGQLYFRNNVDVPASFTLLISASDTQSGLDKAIGSPLFEEEPRDCTGKGKLEYEYKLDYTVHEAESAGIITVTVFDLAGNSAADTLTAILDNDPPPRISNFTINNGATQTNIPVVNLKWKEGEDTGVGLDYYEVKYEGDSNWTRLKSGETHQGKEDDEAVFYVRGVDRVGNILSDNEAATASIKIDLTSPEIIKAIYTDEDGNGIDEDDTIVVEFNEDVQSDVDVKDFSLPVGDDSFGNGAKIIISKEAGRIIVKIGSNPRLRIAGEYSPDTVNAGSPSGIYTSTIKDSAGNTAAMTAAVDIGSSDTELPVIIKAHYVDKGDTGIDAGDEIVLTFSEMVQMSRSDLPTDTEHFSLPVSGDSLGKGAKVRMPDPANPTPELIITLGTKPKLKLEGEFNFESRSAGDPSGIDIVERPPEGDITDISGNDAADTGGLKICIDISFSDSVPPTIVNVLPRHGEEVNLQLIVSAWFSDTGSAGNSGIDTNTIQIFIDDKEVKFKDGSDTYKIEGDWIKFEARLLAGSVSSGRRYSLSFKVKDRQGNLAESRKEEFVVSGTTEGVIDFASYPNPWPGSDNKSDVIYLRYVLAKDYASVIINIYDYAGGLVWSSEHDPNVPPPGKEAGIHKVEWDGMTISNEELANATYFCELVIDDEPKAYWRLVIFKSE